MTIAAQQTSFTEYEKNNQNIELCNKWDVCFSLKHKQWYLLSVFWVLPWKTHGVSSCVDIARLDIVIAILFLQYRRKVYWYFTVMAVSISIIERHNFIYGKSHLAHTFQSLGKNQTVWIMVDIHTIVSRRYCFLAWLLDLLGLTEAQTADHHVFPKSFWGF